MSTTRTPEAFVATWRGNTSTERKIYQQHFLDLCALVGHPPLVQLDPAGAFFTFEAGAAKQDGGQGWADVWYKGRFAIEYKGPHRSLDRAGLENGTNVHRKGMWRLSFNRVFCTMASCHNTRTTTNHCLPTHTGTHCQANR